MCSARRDIRSSAGSQLGRVEFEVEGFRARRGVPGIDAVDSDGQSIGFEGKSSRSSRRAPECQAGCPVLEDDDENLIARSASGLDQKHVGAGGGLNNAEVAGIDRKGGCFAALRPGENPDERWTVGLALPDLNARQA